MRMNYRARTGHYPERVLADTIYRNRNNLAYCKLHGIRLSGPALGRPKKDNTANKKQEYIDSVDRIEVERKFSLAKRCFGLGLIRTKLDTTTMSSVSLSIIAMNVDRLLSLSFFAILTLISKSVLEVFFDGNINKKHFKVPLIAIAS